MKNNMIRYFEELSFNAHPSLQTQYYDGWVLRFANGYSARANSVNLIYPSTIDIKEKIAECEKRYFKQGLPCIFKVTDEWLNTYFTLEKYTNPDTCDTVRKIRQMIQVDTLYCHIAKDGQNIACASAVIENGYVFIANVIVDEAHRGKGYGRNLCESLLAAAMEKGAHTAYLQVIQSNVVATNLYKKLGYQKLYAYWYRKKNKPCS